MLSINHIQQIAAIDQANIAAMMLDMGVVFSLDKRVADIRAEVGKGIQFIVMERHEKVVAYVSYTIVADVLKVKSVQLAPAAGRYILRQLLKAVANATEKKPFNEVRSKVYATNKASVRLHEKLGFEEVKQRDGAIEFMVSKQQLNTALRVWAYWCNSSCASIYIYKKPSPHHMTKAVKYLFLTMAIVELIAELMHWREFIFVLRLFLLPCLLLYYILAKGKVWQPMHKLMVGAIFFSYLGDVSLLLTPEHPTDLHILGIPKSKYLFIAGIAGYMVSHFYFIGAYRQSVIASTTLGLLKRNKWAFAPVVLYGLIMASIVVPKVYADAEKSVATVPVLIYTTVLCSMVAFALNRYGRVPKQSFWWVMVGSLLFLLSDSLIAINFLAFPGVVPEPGFCIMSTFLAAEFLIAEGMLKTKG